MLPISRRLWLIGGTSESTQLAEAIAFLKLPCIVTVTTAAAEALYPKTPTLQVQVGRLDASQLNQFLRQQQISAILDASHPFAVEISQRAIQAAQSLQIPYLRFERPAVESQGDNPQVIYLDSFQTLLESDYLDQQRVLLTVGYKALSLFRNWQNRSTLFARILPAVTSLEAAIAAGFSSDRLIALRPPVTAELEKALWCGWNISLVVTKASGVAGGEAVKRHVAAQLSIPLVVIARPVVEYPQQTSKLSVALEFAQGIYTKLRSKP
ncbi:MULTISPECIES: cobalt-precorrin-6A reductase [unclassified Coleofasciculus]|uniref:cobalt-precorrin-6A reductase n=1 Tax=unclassified Coleofasciculus TaxID=2692782 RepID=UPI00187EB15A|nr:MULTISPECIES: cobalt-precorrin-6A reductase [unclassified Coleofasciculus]MBE9125052.1 cobalt-precorrin-6A reductase [Coleofasciculus sp. LEGE 07081]MBE9147628.1 cobalt-precorrin-6A reductase [Coleofasciculus sp. LEGE 07092]